MTNACRSALPASLAPSLGTSLSNDYNTLRSLKQQRNFGGLAFAYLRSSSCVS